MLESDRIEKGEFADGVEKRLKAFMLRCVQVFAHYQIRLKLNILESNFFVALRPQRLIIGQLGEHEAKMSSLPRSVSLLKN